MTTSAASLNGSTSLTPPAVSTQTPDAPVRNINGQVLTLLGYELSNLFDRYVQDRFLTEQKWMRNLRQYLGIYDPEVERHLPKDGSRAYPRITRVKVISMLSRIMNLMFPGNEDNWELAASPSAEINPDDVKVAVDELRAKYKRDGLEEPPLSLQFVTAAVQYLADQRAADLSKLIKDQLQEIGGDQTHDYIALNRKVAMSGIQYGLGVLEGPYVKTEKQILWGPDGRDGFAPREREIRKPLYEVVTVWDFYPDLSGKTLASGDGYFIRKILGRSEMRKLADRPDFFPDQIKNYMKSNPGGNYVAKPFELDLKSMGIAAHVPDKRPGSSGKYEVLIWKGPVGADKLMQLGVQVPEQHQADDVESEIWLVDKVVIKADINPWRKMGCDVKTIHTFVFDEDDTSPIGNGLPNVVRDSQMSIAAATRMALDNASVVCGPILEMNRQLLMPGEDAKPISAYQTFLRDDDGLTTQWPAVREINIDSHLDELMKLVELFMNFADMETFVGPATGGDMQKQPSEPMRTAAGQSMVRGDAALPFKDIVRNFDFFTQSWILSLVHFNRKFNPHLAKEGDYDVIARGATSLIAKEIRGIQTDILAQTLTEEDRDWIDEEKFVKARLASRDMEAMMVSAEDAMRKRAARNAAAAKHAELEEMMIRAEIRDTLSNAIKNVAQAAKNQASADATTISAALDTMEVGMNDGKPEGTSPAAGR